LQLILAEDIKAFREEKLKMINKPKLFKLRLQEVNLKLNFYQAKIKKGETVMQ